MQVPSIKMIFFIKYIIFIFLEYLEEVQVNKILSRVKNDITKHIKDIQDKLHDIIKQIIMQQMSNWEAKPPIPSLSFLNICKYVNTYYYK